MRWLSLSLISVVLVATIGLGWVFDTLYQEYSGSLKPESMDEVRYAETLTRQLTETLSKSANPEQFIQHWQESSGYTLQLLPFDDLTLPQSLLDSLKDSNLLSLESDSDLSIHFLMAGSDKVLILQIPLTTAPDALFLDQYWITSLFYFLLITLFLLWVRPLITRLIALRASAKIFGKGEFSHRIVVGKASYISDLETEFNHMAQRIEDLVSDVKLLSSAVSHDLRTPLARIRMGLDTLSEESDPIKRQAYEKRINSNIDDMVELIETLLSYARLDQSMLSLDKRPIDLKDLLQKIIPKTQTQVKFVLNESSSKPEPFLVSGDRAYLKMLCNNLIQNALQHCEQYVRIDLQRDEKQILLRISDDGPGIEPEFRADIFKPFVRSRANKHKGHGVGLALCKRVADWHQGSITINQSALLNGAEFVVSLPAIKN
jgi:two-component system OmpR family sensor kinase